MRRFILATACLIPVQPCLAAEPEQNAGLQLKIDTAVERGVQYLGKLAAKDFVARHHGGDNAGVGALIGWAMLESGVPAGDARIKKTAEQVRQLAFANFRTYSLAFTIIFLDRLGDKSDSLLIQSLATRLIEGQLRTGGWTYTCAGPVKDAEIKNLTEYYHLLRKSVLDKAAAQQVELQKQLAARVAAVNRLPLQVLKAGGTDNSNTQMAALALWVARRHGVPVDRVLQLAELRFRTTQQANGRWGYDIERPEYGQAMSMTCAGLIVVALGRATMPQLDLPKNLAADPGVRRGFTALNTFINAGMPKLGFNDLGQLSENGKTFYSLWSLERTCMIYGLDKVHDHDWYAWGARYLLDNQQEAGNWAGYYDRLHAADTCFALLFLRRANPAQDVATKIRKTGAKIDLFAPIKKEKSSTRKTSRLLHSSSSAVFTELMDNVNAKANNPWRRECTRRDPHELFIKP